MLDIKKVVNEKEYVIENLNKRGKDYTLEIEEIIANYQEYIEILAKEEEIQAKINKMSKQIGELKRNGESTDEIIKQIESLKFEIQKLSSKEYKEKYETLLMYIPNLIAEDVPLGKDDKENEEVKVWGTKPKFSFTPKDHYEIEQIKKDFHFEKAANISKSRFVITSNFLARLERAIMNFMLDTHTKNGYEELGIPFIVSEQTLKRSGQLPKFKDDLFKLESTTKSEKDTENLRDFYLIPTSEVVIANYHQGEILNEEDLTKKYTAFSQCFRKEAGSAGRDTAGIIRMHQFGKVELFKYTKQEDSSKELQLMVEDAEKILQQLNLPYRVVNLCSGDIGFGANKTYDLEVWMPGQDKYRECSSCSNVTDFQARRGLIRYKDKDGKKHLAHMLNGSGMATGRILAAILENFQQEDGTVIVPNVLKKYIGE